MGISISQKFIRVFLLGSLFFNAVIPHYIAAEEPVAQAVQLQYTQADLEDKLKQNLAVIDKIEYSIEHLAQVINNNQLQIENKKEIRERLLEIRATVNRIKKAFVTVTPETIHAFALFNKELIHYLRTSIGTKLKAIRSFEFDPTSPQQTSSLEQLLCENKQNAEQLYYEAQNVGLSVLNKAVKKLITLNRDYKILPRTLKIGAAGLAAIYLLMCIDFQSLENFSINAEESKIPGLHKLASTLFDIRQYTGGIPIVDKGILINKTIDARDDGWVTRILFNITKRFPIINLDPQPLITFPILAVPFYDHFKSAWEWTKNASNNLVNYAQGNPVKKQSNVLYREPRFTFDDVIGNDHAKKEFERIILYVSDPEQFDRAGSPPETGCLLAGPPGTGKSFFVEAVAGEIKRRKIDSQEFKFLSFSAADIITHGVEKIFDVARDIAPCVVFIDEFDMIGAQRDRNAKLLSELSVAMSGVMSKDQKNQVIIIAATNKPEHLDELLHRHGRFGKLIRMVYPTTTERLLYLKREFEKRTIILDGAFLQRFAHETDRCSFADLDTIISRVVQNAKIENRAVREQDCEEALDTEIRRIIYHGHDIPLDQQRIVAIHQAGHAYATLLLNAPQEIIKATILPITAAVKEEGVWMKYYKEEQQEPIEYGKIFTIRSAQSELFQQEQDLITACKINLAGHAAEKVILGATGFTYHKHDTDQALAIAKHIAFKGVHENNLPKEIREKNLVAAYNLVNKCEQEVYALLNNNKQKLTILADALLREKTIDGTAIKKLVQQQNSVSVPVAQPTQTVPVIANAVQHVMQQAPVTMIHKRQPHLIRGFKF